MKVKFKSSDSNSIGPWHDQKWLDTVEFEGRKVSDTISSRKDYEYLHGPLCNTLRRKLKKLVESMSSVRILSNKNIDAAIVDTKSRTASAIFEVKTSALLSSQLYTAYGQLAYYKHIYGNSATRLFLVLPNEVRGQFTSKEFFNNAGIQVIFGGKGKFKSLSGHDLSSVVEKCMRA